MKFQRGESLFETLAAMLIITLGMTMLASSAISAARTNDKAEAETTFTVPLTERQSGPEAWRVSVTDGAGGVTTVSVNGYEIAPEGGGRDEHNLYYYVP